MQNKIESWSFLWLLLAVSVAFLWVIKPFFGPIFWAVAVAVLFSSTRNWLSSKLPTWPNTVALVTLLICIVIVIIPVLFTVSAVADQVASIYNKVEAGELDITERLEKLQSGSPTIDRWLDQANLNLSDLRERAAEAATAIGKFVAQHSLSVGQNTFAFILNIGVMLYLAFFFLRDGDHILDLLVKALPLGDTRERYLFRRFANVMRATVKGNLVVAVVQGALGGFIFWALAIPAPFLWGVVMIILSLIPAIGAGLIWGPVAIYLFASGNYWKATILVAFGILIIGLVDNILRPILVGRDTHMPDFMILITTLGGIVLFGVNGFVMGPIVAALFISSWEIFIRDYQHDDISS